MIKINLGGLKLETQTETPSATAEIIHEDGNHLRINILDRDERMLTRVEIEVEGNTILLKAWEPTNWVKRIPDHEILLTENL